MTLQMNMLGEQGAVYFNGFGPRHITKHKTKQNKTKHTSSKFSSRRPDSSSGKKIVEGGGDSF